MSLKMKSQQMQRKADKLMAASVKMPPKKSKPLQMERWQANPQDRLRTLWARRSKRKGGVVHYAG